MRLAIAQFNVTVGDVSGNVDKVCEFAKRAQDGRADLVVFPELAVTGYPPQDLLLDGAFVRASAQAVEQIAARLAQGPAVVVGFAEPHAGKLYNSAALISGGRQVAVARKSLLPTYDVFDERRYFTPAQGVSPVQVPGQSTRLGLHVCEDMWDDSYDVKPCSALAEAGADLLVNVSASPFHVGKSGTRIEVARRRVRETGLPLVYVNLVGAQDELLFDGNSFVLDAQGRLVHRSSAFQEELSFVELPPTAAATPLADPAPTREAELRAALVLGVRDYFRKLNIRRAIVGLSGGIDSALVAAIASEGLGPRNVIGVSMPSSYSSEHSRTDAEVLAKNLGIDFSVMPIQASVDVAVARFEATFGPHKQRTAVENLQARERGKILMEIANDVGGMVLNTGNKTELALGYCTLYGDMCGGLAVIGDLSKTDVYALARHINAVSEREVIPAGTLTKVPSAELAEGQFDPFDYSVVSPLMEELVEQQRSRAELLERGYAPDVVDDCLRRYRFAEFKRRQAPICLKVTQRAFGQGRRLPVVNGWHG